jgi:CRISPR-associated protein Cas6
MNQFWSEDNEEQQEYIIPGNILDFVFTLKSKCIPMNHAYLLYEAIHQALPWLDQEDNIGVHPIYGAESGNGWERPDTEVLFLSKRQKMTLRLPKSRSDDVKQLVGMTLELEDYMLTIGEFSIRQMNDLPTVFARSVVTNKDQEEHDFLIQSQQALEDMGINGKKMMCGLKGRIELPDRTVYTRSLMLADLDKEESVKIQETGLGPMRQYGCGLFMPQKGIKAVKPD